MEQYHNLQQGYRQVTVFLDNARTHGKRMQDEVSRLLQEQSKRIQRFHSEP